MAAEEKKDINWINAMKAICMIFVLYRHCSTYYGREIDWLNSFSSLFYVTGFFFVSGYLLFWKQLSSHKIDETVSQFAAKSGKGLLGNIFHRIMVPSMLFSLIEFVPKTIIRGGQPSINEAIADTIGGGTYWFTGALAVAELLVLVLLLTRNRNIWFYALLSIALALAGLWLKESHITVFGSSSLPWFYKEGLTFLPYMAMGGVFWRYERQLEKMLNRPVLALLSALCLASLLLPSYSGILELVINLTRCSLFAACFVQICKFLPRISILTFIGQKSIAFYFMSGAIPNILALLLRRVYSGVSVAVMLGMFGGALALSIVAVWLLNRYLPFLFDLRLLSKNRHN